MPDLMHIYYCWITALLPSYQDGIVAGLARKGYMVGPASQDGKVMAPSNNNTIASLLCLSVYKPTESDVNKVHEDLVAVLYEMKAYYFSIVVSLATEAIWAGSNIKMPVIESNSTPDKKMN